MAERLTPYLRRQVLNLPPQDRIALAQAINATFHGTPTPAERLEYLADKMCAASGLQIRERTNARRFVTARWLFAFVARREGYPQEVIGAFLGLDHSSICHGEKRVSEMFALPEMYKHEIELYNKFIESL